MSHREFRTPTVIKRKKTPLFNEDLDGMLMQEALPTILNHHKAQEYHKELQVETTLLNVNENSEALIAEMTFAED